ncbi:MULTISPECIES: hypothetical protein [Saccharothrix]|uniref:Uncharacterized protein n=1 Tax=Saccharothrix longispora TaxID=33920 RepID=A0ABU1PTB8_9PSEU|nr:MULTISPECIES: hypothetical protein [Saccharothrix]MDR6593892.1 hypothetical protein [Saccharothrix longispora]MDU0292542.1 hypothetical protein [Saccharothrix longispora]
MAKHRLGQSEGRQWGGPDLVSGAEDALARGDREQAETTPERLDDD